MNKVELQEIASGALQEKFSRAFENVVKNLQDPNTSFKNKRQITITMKFTQNENRDDISVEVAVAEKLAPQAPMKTAFAIGTDLRTGETYAQEYGKQIRGQMNLDDYQAEQVVDGKVIDTDTGEIIKEDNTVVDFRKAAN